MGASPDGIVNCACCGKGSLEIKCPYSCVDKSFLEATGEQRFFLELHDGMYRLKKDHAYYYQVQMQIKFLESSYCDFVVWREQELIVQRILPDVEFIEHALTQATKFFKYAILPELLGKYYSRLPTQAGDEAETIEPLPALHQDQNQQSSASQGSKTSQDHNQDVWCYCRAEESGEMIQCESGDCKIEWFHIECLKITTIPKGKWMCPDCRKKVVAKRRNKKKQ